MKILTTLYTRQHIFVVETLVNLAKAYNKLGLIQEEIKTLEEAYVIGRSIFKVENNIIIAGIQHELANLYRSIGRYQEGKVLLEQALTIETEHYKTRKHIAITRTLNDLAIVYGYMEHRQKQRELLEEVLTLQIGCFGTRFHIEVATTLINLGKLYGLLNDKREKQYLEEGLAIQVEHYGTREHIAISNTMYNLSFAYKHLNDFVMQRKLLEFSLAIGIQFFHNTQPLNSEFAIHAINLAMIHKENNNLHVALLIIDYAYQALQRSNIISDREYLREVESIRLQIKQRMQIRPNDWFPSNLNEWKNSSHDLRVLFVLGYFYYNQADPTNTIFYLEKAITLAPELSLPKTAANLAACYHIRGQAGDLVLAYKYFDYAIKCCPTGIIYCAYGEFLYECAAKKSFSNLFIAAIAKFKEAIKFKDEEGIILCSNLDKPVLEEELCALVLARGSIIIKPICLAYYLLIKSYLALKSYQEARESLEQFDEHMACLLCATDDAPEKLQIESLLLEKVRFCVESIPQLLSIEIKQYKQEI